MTLRQAAQKTSHHTGREHLRRTWDGCSRRRRFSPGRARSVSQGWVSTWGAEGNKTSPISPCGGAKCLPRSVSDSSLVNEVWNFLMMVVNVVGCTNNCEYLRLLMIWTFELVVYNLSASGCVRWPAVVPEFTVNMTMKGSVKHFQDKHFPFLPRNLRNTLKSSL